MPPIRVTVVRPDGEARLPDVVAGLSISFTDYSSTPPHIIMVTCNKADDGGSISHEASENTNLRAFGTLRVVTPTYERVEPIPKGGELIIPSATRFGPSTIRLTHIPKQG